MRAAVPRVVLVVLLLPAVALTAARITGDGPSVVIQAVAFSPYALALYAAALVPVLLRRRWRSPALVLAAAGALVHLWWLAPLFTGATPAPAAGAEPVRVMTANMRLGHGDGIALVAAAAERQVDLLVVQEVTERVLADMESAGLAELFPHRVGLPGRAAWGTMVFSRAPLTEPAELPTEHSSWAVSVKGMRVWAVHPAYALSPQQWREEHAALLAVAEEQRPDLVLGDFNATLDHEPMRAYADAGYRSVAELANEGWQPTWPANGLYRRMGLALPTAVTIDHVLVAPTLAAISPETVAVEGSDHTALVAEVARR